MAKEKTMSEDKLAERKRLFLEAKAARERAEKERKSWGGSPVDIPDFEYLTLEQNKCQVFRMVGDTIEMRNKPSDPLLVEKSIIQADDGSYFTCIWHPNKDWPFRNLVRKLAKYKYDPKAKTKTYDNQGCEYLDRYLNNGKKEPSMYETGMAAKKYVLANVIDRMDSWCKDNKHTKLLAWSKTEKEGKTFYEAGMTYGLYKHIFDNKCTSIGSHYEEVDFVVRRFDQKTRPSDDTYYLVMYEEEKRAIQNWSEKDKVDYMSYINKEDYLSDEELGYTRYDLEGIPFISQPTPIGVIMSKLGKFIKGIDAKYGWNLWEEFVEWKEKEVSTKKENEAIAETEKSEKPATIEVSDVPSPVEEKPVASQPVSKVKKAVSQFTDEDFDTFAGLKNLPENERKHIVKVDSDEGEITFDIDADAQCGNCGSDIPDSFTVCPYCAQKY